jgi:hypothetical protein
VLRSASLLAFAAAILLVPGGSAFDSIPGGPHDQITDVAARSAAYPTDGIPGLQQATRGPDVRDNKLDPKATKVTNFEVTDEYRPFHHCDRVPPATDAESFSATVQYIREEGDMAVAASHVGNASNAVNQLGKALHALEDCFSHSNAIDLSDPDAVVRAVNSQGPMPGGLRLTGFLPGASDNEHPPGDDYSHGDFAKDSAEKNAESQLLMADNHTKYEHARSLASAAASEFLSDILARLSAGEITALGNVSAQKENAGLPKVHIPSLPVLPVIGAVALVFAIAVRRR